jgi:dihydroorotate dehydrogenase electron transfer subunit
VSAPRVNPAAIPGRFETPLVKRVELSGRYFLMVLERPKGFAVPQPGAFVHVLPPPSGRFFLRRPLSILDCDHETLSLIIVEKGRGTHDLRRLPVGRTVDVIGPLGRSFPRLPGRRVLAVAGGVGLAPLYFYRAKWNPDWCAQYRLLYGARTREDLFLDRFEWRFDDIGMATDDGTYGFRGNVVEMAKGEIGDGVYDVVFSCGPGPMLRAAADLARRAGLTHYVSLENRMACGMGACRSCVVVTANEAGEARETVCHDGPVFDAGRLVWDKLPDV